MTVEQFYLGCLSQASYLVYDPTTLRAMVVDPRRDIGEYLARADELNLSIEHVVLTHVHADFVPGYAELERATGATVAMSERSPVTFPIRRLADGDRIDLGDSKGVAVEVLATPGHTPESITLAVFDRATDATPTGLITGDTLFIGDVGRPDLLGAAGRSAEDMARELYHSLRERILNYALAAMSADRFVEVVTEGLAEPPVYFSGEVALNRRGHVPMDDAPPAELTLSEVAGHVRDGSLVLDVRDPQDFAAGHVTGSVNVAHEPTHAQRASRVIAEQFAGLLASDVGVQLVDVRAPGEHSDGAIPDSLNLPLPRLLSLLENRRGPRVDIRFPRGADDL